MSSVDFHKCKGGTGEAAAMLRHMSRHDGYDRFVEYDNPHIDRSRSKDNYVIGNGLGENNDEVYRRLQKRVAEIDKELPPKRIRKDRVTMMTYTIAAPDGLRPDQERRFFQLAYDRLASFSGGYENLSPGYIHKDEIHDYKDATTGRKRTSRAHMHVAGIPFVVGVGVNGKKFETRTRMQELNREIDKACRDRLGVSFMTGHSGRSGQSVETLKAASIEKAVEEAVGRLEGLTMQITAYEDDLRRLQENYNEKEKALSRMKESIDQIAHDYEIADRIYMLQAFAEHRPVDFADFCELWGRDFDLSEDYDPGAWLSDRDDLSR